MTEQPKTPLPPVRPLSQAVDYSNFQHHQHASIFPEMNSAEFDLLAEDIKLNGVRVPITLYEGKILDGRHRYKAASKFSIPLKEENFTRLPSTVDPLAFVVGANLHRRHLSDNQRALVAATITNMRRGDNQHTTAGAVDTAKAAKMLNVSEKSVTRARALVDKGSPQLQQLVREGKAKLGAVQEVLDKPPAEQVKSWKAKKAEKVKALKDAKAKAKTDGKPKTPEANQKLLDVDDLVKKWNSFDDMQRRDFVERCIEPIKVILKEIEYQEAKRKQAAAA
jgi:ParB-like chromosome segregation protein Spo0J